MNLIPNMPKPDGSSESAGFDQRFFLTESQVHSIIRRIGLKLQLAVDISGLKHIQLDGNSFGISSDPFNGLIDCARQAGIQIFENQLTVSETIALLEEDYPVVIANESGLVWVLENLSSRRIEASRISGEHVTMASLDRRQLGIMLRTSGDSRNRVFAIRREFECSSMSAAPSGNSMPRSQGRHHGIHDGIHLKPMRRFLAMLRLDQRDLWTIALFALVAGILTLATPLAVESLVNVVIWGTLVQPLIVLGLMLLVSLGLAGVLRILQAVMAEVIQRRQFVRIVGDLANRFPFANRQALEGVYPRELANRVFDIMTIQKSTAVLLLDGISIVLASATGMLLLSLYHPFLLFFNLLLLISMVSITWLLGRGGIRTAIDESLAKYRVAHWLQDVLATPGAFKVNGGGNLAVERAHRLTADYLSARQAQFRVVIRQVAFAIGLQVIASTVLLGLGGWLVMRQELTLGQLVASELVVTVVVGAFAKAGRSLEKYYDLMAGIDKVGILLDIPVDPHPVDHGPNSGPVAVRWSDLVFEHESMRRSCHLPAGNILPGKSLALIENSRSGNSMLLKSLAGLLSPARGLFEIGVQNATWPATSNFGRAVAYAGHPIPFHASVEEIVELGRSDVSHSRVREVLTAVGLWETVASLPDGIRTVLQSDGYPLSASELVLLGIAQAVAGNPQLLLIDRLLDELPPALFQPVWETLIAGQLQWTLLIATGNPSIANRCDEQIELGE